MQRLLVLILVMICAVPAMAADAEPDAKQIMMIAIRDGDWTRANRAAAQTGRIARDIVEWHRLRKGGEGSFDEYLSFMDRNADWPGLPLMKRRGETSIPKSGNPQRVLDYFGDGVPTTGTGVVRLIDAFRTLGQEGDAEALAVLSWRTISMTEDAERELLRLYAGTLAAHHEARLNEMVWQNARRTARRMFPRVSDDQKALAEARLGLRARVDGVNGLIAKVPETLQDDPGLLYERFNWRARKGLTETAIPVLKQQSTGPEALGRPALWANWRRIYARMEMRAGNYANAYTLASTHFLLDGSDYADLEWLSGYLALRFLNDPELALLHFDRFLQAVETPISLSRGGYWLGRAYTAAGDTDAAQTAYQFGAQFQTSYYGLLAAEAVGRPLDPTLSGAEAFPPLETSDMAQSSVLAAALMLYDIGEVNLAERFLTHLVESQDRIGAGQLGALATTLKDPHLSVMIAKRAARYGNVIPAAYFPIHPLVEKNLPVAPELALAIARRESEFDPVVISPAGARGLMQVMPGTAKDVAEELQIDYSRDRLTSDPDYNITLGTNYLAGLIEIFGDNPVLVSVGYNAGPGRAVSWVRDRGDPRTGAIDVVDWVEMIPFRETRNYVMRVTESLPVYRARLGNADTTLEFTKLLKGQ